MARTWKKLTPGSSASGESVPPDAATRRLRLRRRAGATQAERVLHALFIIADRREERQGAAAAVAAMEAVARDMALEVK